MNITQIARRLFGRGVTEGKHRTDDLTLGELIEAWVRISRHQPRHAA